MIRSMPYAHGWNDIRKKPSGKWEARWSDENGNARGKCFNTKTQATKYARDMANGIVDAALGIGASRKDVHEAVEEFFLWKRRDAGTIKIYERHFGDFFAHFPTITLIGHLTREIFVAYTNYLFDTKKHRPGGVRHIQKTFRAFTKFCIIKRWLTTSPFLDLRAPRSDFQGQALSPDKYEKMISIDPRYEVDVWINRALRIGNPCMMRISTVWGASSESFREPDEFYLPEIKDQEAAWIKLHPAALEVVKELMTITPAGQRFFTYWPTVDSMRQSMRKKAARVGLSGVRFHDAAKVTRVTELDAAGYGLGKISALSNTSKATLAKHYIKPDRRAAFAEYQTYGRPISVAKESQTEQKPPQPGLA